MKTTISTKGRLVLPVDIRRQDQVEAGHVFDIERVRRGEYRLLRRPQSSNEGLVDWLAACPAKGFFVRIGSEETDAL